MFTPLISVETHKQTKQTNETKTNKQKKTHARTHAHISWQGKDAVFGKRVETPPTLGNNEWAGWRGSVAAGCSD